MTLAPPRTLLAVMLLFGVLPTAAHAAPVTLNFIGAVDFIGDPFGLVGSLVIPVIRYW
jgi:hypothetical protein